MNIKFVKLIAECKESTEEIRFASDINFFHGKISSGKSSILRAIDFCLGGKIERTPAIVSELVAVTLELEIEETILEIRRLIDDDNFVQATWAGPKGNGRLRLPVKARTGKGPLLGDNVYCLSDFIYHFLDMPPLYVERSKTKPKSPTIRLSFRDIQKFCYLNQDDMDSSFFELKKPILLTKSRDAMNFVLGFHTVELSQLKHQLDTIRKKRKTNRTAVKERKEFLRIHGIGTISKIERQLKSENEELKKAREELENWKTQYAEETHPYDELRQDAEEKREEIQRQRKTCADLRAAINDQESLKAEYIGAKMKHQRFLESSSVLSRVSFEKCPLCGRSIQQRPNEDVCILCGQKKRIEKKPHPEEALLKEDLETRISELDEAINERRSAVEEESQKLTELEQELREIEMELKHILTDYDSRYLSGFLRLQSEVTKHVERIKNLQFIEQMVNSIKKIEEESKELKKKQKTIKEKIEMEEKKFEEGKNRVKELETEYLEIMKKVGVPGITSEDVIEIDAKTWIPTIKSNHNEEAKWNYYNAGSAGKKTLLKTCFSLALQVISQNNDLALPSYLMIDTPMKNIGEDVNKDLFESFYSTLYELASTDLAKCQFLIVDKEYFPHDERLQLDVFERFLKPDDDDNPPFISYYRGP